MHCESHGMQTFESGTGKPTWGKDRQILVSEGASEPMIKAVAGDGCLNNHADPYLMIRPPPYR